jgi:hypothetical protein
LSIKCGKLNVPQSHGPPQTVIEIALSFMQNYSHISLPSISVLQTLACQLILTIIIPYLLPLIRSHVMVEI